VTNSEREYLFSSHGHTVCVKTDEKCAWQEVTLIDRAAIQLTHLTNPDNHYPTIDGKVVIYDPVPEFWGLSCEFQYGGPWSEVDVNRVKARYISNFTKRSNNTFFPLETSIHTNSKLFKNSFVYKMHLSEEQKDNPVVLTFPMSPHNHEEKIVMADSGPLHMEAYRSDYPTAAHVVAFKQAGQEIATYLYKDGGVSFKLVTDNGDTIIRSYNKDGQLLENKTNDAFASFELNQ